VEGGKGGAVARCEIAGGEGLRQERSRGMMEVQRGARQWPLRDTEPDEQSSPIRPNLTLGTFPHILHPTRLFHLLEHACATRTVLVLS